MLSVLRATTHATILRWVAVMASAIIITACDNSGSDNSGGDSTPPPTSTTYTVSGSVSGVTAGGLVLSNNGTTLPVGAGATGFLFTSGLATGTAYSVMVQSAPAGLLCSVANGSGTIGTSSVTDIAVTCTAQNHSLGGSISGLDADGLVLVNNGASVTVNSGATTFAFPTLIATGTPYSVAVQTAPAGYTCTVAKGSGTMGTADISNVVVTCSTQAYSVGGTISGYSSAGLVLANGTDRIAPVTGASSFIMPTPVANTSSYAVTIATQPTGMHCSIQNGSGTVMGAIVTNVAITCSDQSYALGGTVSGLTAAGLMLSDGVDTVTVAAGATTFSFPTPVAFGATYTLTVAGQPAGLICSVTGSGTGTMPASNVNTLAVACGQPYTLGGSVSGLTVTGLVLANGSASSVTVPANATSFVFPTGVLAGVSYAVTVATQPNGYTCTVSGGSGTMPAANVNSPQVTCSINSYTLGGSVTGLTGLTSNGLVLTDGTDSLPVATNATSFSMPTALAFNSTYTVSVQTQPIGMKCTLTSYTGTMPAANVTTVQVTCAPREWTWMSGSSTGGASGMYGAPFTFGPTLVPGARDSQTTWTDSAGHLWMFGGEGYDQSGNIGDLNDVWEFDPATQQWAFIAGSNTAANAVSLFSGAGATPGGRIKSMVWTDGSGNAWLFGGIQLDSGGANDVALNELWELNMSTGQWTFVGNPAASYVSNQFVSGNWPPARGAAVTWTDSTGKFWMFGGTDFNATTPSDYNDLWAFDPGAGEWAWEGGSSSPGATGTYPTAPGTQAAGNVPGARYAAVGWTDTSGRFWLFGGGVHDDPVDPTFSDAYNDLWVYVSTSNTWTWMGGANIVDTAGDYGVLETPAATNAPGARAAAVAWTDPAGNLWMFGGAGLGSGSGAPGALNDLWVYNTVAQQWTWMNGPNVANAAAGNYGSLGVPAASNQPGSRVSASGWFDASGNFWLFGGVGYDIHAGNDDLNDLWIY